MSIKAVLFDKDGTLMRYEDFWFPVAEHAVALIIREFGIEKDNSRLFLDAIGTYDGKSGIERFPENGLNTTTTLYKYTPGTEISLCAGAINGHNFITVDGELVTELIDPNPLKGGHVGFSPYCTKLKIRDIEIRKIYWEKRDQAYDPEF